MKSLIVSTMLLLAIIGLGAPASAADLPKEFLDAASHGRLVALQSWSPSLDSDVSLSCAIVQSVKESAQASTVCYNGAKRAFALNSDEAPLSMFVMGESGNLMTLWEAGDGTYILRAFSFRPPMPSRDQESSERDAKRAEPRDRRSRGGAPAESSEIRKVLEGSSKLMPEFVYAPTPPGSLMVDAKQTVPGGYWSERIIIANMDWVHDAKGGADQYLPITADIFTWDGKRYQSRDGVKWTDRLK